MSHYGKLAALAIRLVALAWFIISLLMILAVFTGPFIFMGRYTGRGFLRYGGGGIHWGYLIVPALLYLACSLVLFVLSKPIARFITSDFEPAPLSELPPTS